MQTRIRRLPRLALILTIAALVHSGLPAQAAASDQSAAAALPGCRVDYRVAAQFTGGFVVYVTISNDGPAVNGWQVDFTFPTATQRVTSGFSARWTQTGQAVAALSNYWNARIPAGSSVQIGFQGAFTGANPVPTDVRVFGCGDQPFPPTPLVTSPINNSAMLEGQVTVLRAETLGFPATVRRIDFTVDGVLFATATTVPFSAVWYPLPLGTHTITATGYDDAGTVATSAPVLFTVRPRT